MSKFCPIMQDTVLYAECIECDSRVCRSDIGWGNIQKESEERSICDKKPRLLKTKKNYLIERRTQDTGILVAG